MGQTSSELIIELKASFLPVITWAQFHQPFGTNSSAQVIRQRGYIHPYKKYIPTLHPFCTMSYVKIAT